MMDLTRPATCTSCGQTATQYARGVPALCAGCRDALRAPQGETVRLFEPAPNQLAGQLALAEPQATTGGES